MRNVASFDHRALARDIRDAVLPLWPLPVTGGRNPAEDLAAERHVAWMREFGLLASGEVKYLRLRAHEAASRAFPRADVDVLALAADWTMWFAQFDDFFDEGVAGTSPDRARMLTDRLRGPVDAPEWVPAELWGRTRLAYEDLCHRTRELTSGLQWDVFHGHLELYFGSLIAESMNRQRGIVPEVSDYCRIRRYSGAMQPLLDLQELAESVRLPRVLYGASEFHEMIDAAADAAAWINDVFSAAKELHCGDVHNLVIVLAHRDGSSPIEAAVAVTGMIAARVGELDAAAVAVREFLVREQVPQPARARVEDWLRGIRGSLAHAEWYLRLHRAGTDDREHP